MRDYYEILGVDRGADDAGLKAAYRKLAMQHHPDRNDGCQDAAARFKEINEAFQVLSDKQKRAAYDRFGHAGVNGVNGNGAGFADVHDIFNEVFGDVFGEMFGRGQRRPSGPTRGADLRYDLEITLEQAYAGAEVAVKVPAALTCDDCSGSGCAPGAQPTACASCNGAGRVRASQGFFTIERTCPRCGGDGRLVLDPCKSCGGQGQMRRERTLEVRIPPGVDDGARIRLASEGDAGARGGPRGDLYIFLSVKPHELFERDGLDLLCSAPVPMAIAVLGGAVEVPCLLGGENCDGECRIEVKVPEGAQTGRTVRLKGRGMPSLRSRERGDLVVELFIETPTKLSVRQKELMREFAGLCGEQQHPRQAAFFHKARRFWDGITRPN
jgi:molecular chaperone DnaJ